MQIIIKFDFVVSLLHPVCMLPLECDGKHCPRWSLLYTMMFPVASLVCVSWAARCDWTVYVSVTETRFQPLWPAHTHTHTVMPSCKHAPLQASLFSCSLPNYLLDSSSFFLTLKAKCEMRKPRRARRCTIDQTQLLTQKLCMWLCDSLKINVCAHQVVISSGYLSRFKLLGFCTAT